MAETGREAPGRADANGPLFAGPEAALVKPRHVPERKCVACGRRHPKRELHRIVRTPEGLVTVDPTGKKAGRGAYLCGSPGCWERGVSKAGLDRSLGVSLSPENRDDIMAYYRRAVAEKPSVER